MKNTQEPREVALEKAVNHLKQNPSTTRKKLGEMFGLSERQLRKINMGGAAPVVSASPKIRPRSLMTFIAVHDIPQKIRNAIAGIKDGYVTEEELRQLCEVPVQSWRRNADLPEFADFKFKIDGTVLWAGADTIKEMKKITGRA